MMNKTPFYLAIALASSACASSPTDDIWMPPGGNGKADGYTTISGADIPSAFVDTTKSYMISRSIGSLTTVGAFDMVQSDLAKRIDGIIANMPADGRLHLAELVRMEDPTIHASLFPNEQTALPKLWKLVEAPDADATVNGPKDNFGVLDTSTPPSAAIPPSSLAINSLSTELQSPASRLENLYNSDANTTTVTLADLASGIANPAPFTPTEVAAFSTIQAVFRTKAVAAGETKLVVSPGPGPFTKDATLGPATFHMTGATKIDEQRNVYYSTNMASTLVATQSLGATVALPMGAQVLVLAQDSGTETVIPAGAVPSLEGGEYVFEVWQGGARTFSTNAKLPVMTSQATIQLDDKLDYALVSGLTPLVRNLTAATMVYSGGYYSYTTHYTFDKTALPPPAMVSQQAITGTTSPAITLPAGRYSFPQAGSNLYVYPSNVLWFNLHGTLVRMVPVGNNGSAPTRLVGAQNQQQITFDATSNTLYCGSCQPQVNVQLNASMRDI